MASKVHGGGQIGTIILQGPPAFSRGNNDTANLIEKDPKAKSKAINPGCMEIQALRIQYLGQNLVSLTYPLLLRWAPFNAPFSVGKQESWKPANSKRSFITAFQQLGFKSFVSRILCRQGEDLFAYIFQPATSGSKRGQLTSLNFFSD